MRLIDADALIEDYRDIIDCEIDHAKYQNTVREIVDSTPTVEPERGEWIEQEHGVMCTHCGALRESFYKGFRYCPDCGAYMGGE